MVEVVELAEESARQEANRAFRNKDFAAAIALYTRAIKVTQPRLRVRRTRQRGVVKGKSSGLVVVGAFTTP
mgnify:CR=1 FL=1